MSSLWTPGGEHRVERTPAGAAREDAPTTPGAGTTEGAGADSSAAAEAELAALERQLLAAPAADVVANHCYGLFELAALHLRQQPPELSEARLAIDAFGAIVEGLEGRLGAAGPMLTDGLAQLRLAFVQLSSASGASEPGASAASASAASASASSASESGASEPDTSEPGAGEPADS